MTAVSVDRLPTPSDVAWAAASTAAKSAVVALATDAFVNSKQPRFRGKAMRVRAIGYAVVLFIVPVIWRLRGRPEPYPRRLDLLATLPILVDAAGNATGLYQGAHVDDAVHFGNGALISGVVGSLVQPRTRTAWEAATFATSVTMAAEAAWEIFEWAAMKLGARRMELTYDDTIDDLIETSAGALLGGIVTLLRHPAELRRLPGLADDPILERGRPLEARARRYPEAPMPDAIDLLDVLKGGLPPTARPGRHVVIVGAGIAGLTAGMLLKEAGHQVTILEARNRLGGRIYTYRGFAGRMYGEFGAMRFPRQHRLAQHLIHDRFKLPTKPFGMEDQDTFIYLQGKAVRRSAFTATSFDFDLPPGEQGKEPARILHDAMQPLIDLVAQPNGWQQVIDQFDRYSLLGYLLERGVSEHALWLLGPLFNIEGRFHFSLVEWFAHWYDDVFGDLEYIDAGADTLPHAFAPILMDSTRLGAEVHAIHQGRDGITVRYRDSVGTEGKVTADECILTVPLVLLRHMEINGLDVDKWFTIRNVYYGRAHKIFMQFSRRWWADDYAIDHGVTVTDLAIRNVVYTPAGQDPSIGKGVIIASYAWEQDSMAYSMLDESQRIAQALEDLTKIHPEAARTFEFGISHDWALDRHGGGIGPLFRPFEMTSRVFDDITRPVDRLWFAGDACSRLSRRWIEGAISSGVINAYAINAGLRNALPTVASAQPI